MVGLDPYYYHRNCTEFPNSGSSFDALVSMIDDAIDITYRTFFQYVSLEMVSRGLFDYAMHPRGGLTLKNDWHVSYHRSKFGEKRCYFLQHSGIEYIFLRSGEDE